MKSERRQVGIALPEWWMQFDTKFSPRMLGRIAWIGVIAGGGASLVARHFHSPVLGWTALVLIGAGFVAMCWIGGCALQDLRADQKDDTEAK